MFELTARERDVLDLIRRNPLVSQQEMADILEISRAAVGGHVMNLVAKGVIRGRGYFLEDDPVVLVFGGANVDLEGRSSSPLIAGDSNPGAVTRSPGGVGRNIAENLARVGITTRLYTALGDDPDGRWLYQHTSEAGVDMSGTLWTRGARTSIYLSILDPSGELAVAVNDMGILSQLGPGQVPVAALGNAAAIVVDANLGDETVARIFESAAGTPVFVDPVSTAKATRIRPYLEGIHTLKPNRAEAEVLSGTEINDRASLGQAAKRLLDAGVARVVVTLGSEGAFHADADGSGMIAGVRRPLASVTGAGDALMAGLVWAHLEGRALGDAVRVGTELASNALGRCPVDGDFRPDDVGKTLKGQLT